MAKGLQGLIRYHNWQLDEKKRALAALNDQRAAIDESLKKLDAEVIAEKKVAAEMTGVPYGLDTYLKAAKKRRTMMENIARSLDHRIEKALEEIREGFQELKKYEIAQQERDRKEAAEIARKEAIDMDEVAQNGFQRRKAEDEAAEEFEERG
jgi:flagellar biosynthesis chaperone FliJ